MQIEQQDVDAVIGIVRAGADLVRRMERDGRNRPRAKSNEIDLVTEADVACEHFLRDALAHLYPSVGLWGEESNRRPETDLFWLVDPIDGTSNYANGVAYAAVTVSLQLAEETLLAVTHHIGLDWTFFARPGEGAYLREPHGAQRRLRVNDVDILRKALLTTGFPYHRAESTDNNSAEFAYFMPRTTGVRNLGSAALDMAHVAMGSLAGYWEAWMNPWDLAAGALLVREAGGRVTNYAGQEWTIEDNNVVASNGRPGLHSALVDGIRTARSQLSATRLTVAPRPAG